jgi:hypothetical protein
MTLRIRYCLAAAAGLWITLPLLAQEPARFVPEREQALTPRFALFTNQRLADTIAEQLRQNGQLHHYRIEVTFKDGSVELTGAVADQPQREEALRIVQGVPGVEHVLDHLSLSSDGAVTTVQAQTPVPLPAPKADLAPPSHRENGPETPVEPVPSLYGQSSSSYDANHPPMPPYAWPTYAPYNNYSRVAYPEAYPYGSWPFIGPVYPFPKIPLGWRSVKLEWQDGYWWFSKVATKHDWWRLKYW